MSGADDNGAGGLHKDTWLVSAGRPDTAGAPLNTPLVPASNFLLGAEQNYAREDGTPTTVALEAVLGGLENAQSLVFSTGMAAAAAVLDQLPRGSRLLIPDVCYQGVAGLADAGAARGRWTVTRIPVEDTADWISMAPDADLIWVESPTNPMLTVCDLRTVCAAARNPGSMLVVDNTFATPLNQQPLDLGADISLQSATKFIGGHSDLMAGVLSSRDPRLLEKLHRSRILTGATVGALEAFSALRGLRTMALRLERAQDNAGKLADFLDDHPAVERMRYPGLANDPGHATAAAQSTGFGSMLSFDMRDGAEAADAVCRKLRLIHHATSLGAVESTIERRGAIAGQEHIPPGLLRLSVGIENCEDLEQDLVQALQ